MEKGKYFVKNSAPLIDLWKYRGLFFMLVKQQFAIFYNRAIFGIVWMILNPLLYLLILVGVFFKVAGVRPNLEIPFVLAAFTGLIAWNMFSHFVSQAAMLLRSFHALISKIYLPRIYILYSHIVNLFLEYITGCVILFIILIFMHYPLHWTLLLLFPLFFYAIFVFSGPMIITSLLSYQFKDFQFLVPFLLQIGFYISPIWFSPASIKDPIFVFLYHCNPVVGVITLARAAVLGTLLPGHFQGLFISFFSGAILFLIGVLYWYRQREFLADIGL